METRTYISLGRAPLDRALELALGADTLRAVHGPSLRLQRPDFDPHTCDRSFDFEVAIPRMLRPVMGGKRAVRVGVTQTLIKSPGKWVVHGNLHFPGSALVDIRPTFVLWNALGERGERGGTVLDAAVRHRVLLPPPLRGMAEAYLSRRSTEEFRKLECAISRLRAGLPGGLPAAEQQHVGLRCVHGVPLPTGARFLEEAQQLAPPRGGGIRP